MESVQKDNWDKAKIIAEIFAIIAIIFYGQLINTSIKEREINLQLVQVAIDILRTEPNISTKILREWAIEVVDNYSGVPFTEHVKKELLNKQLPAASHVTMSGEPVTFGGEPVTFGKKLNEKK